MAPSGLCEAASSSSPSSSPFSSSSSSPSTPSCLIYLPSYLYDRQFPSTIGRCGGLEAGFRAFFPPPPEELQPGRTSRSFGASLKLFNQISWWWWWCEPPDGLQHLRGSPEPCVRVLGCSSQPQPESIFRRFCVLAGGRASRRPLLPASLALSELQLLSHFTESDTLFWFRPMHEAAGEPRDLVVKVVFHRKCSISVGISFVFSLSLSLSLTVCVGGSISLCLLLIQQQQQQSQKISWNHV